MRKFFCLIILLAVCLCGCSKEINPKKIGLNETAPNDAVSDSAVDIPDNLVIDIDISKIVKVDAPDCLPVSTTSIREILSDTGRFAYDRISYPVGGGAVADEFFRLDKTDSEGSYPARVSYQVLSGNTTQIISYNFNKSAINGNEHDAVKWGLGVLLRIFGAELTDNAWSDIMEVAAKSETEDAWGTDYEGYADEENGIRLIYANLGNNVQIDIRPF